MLRTFVSSLEAALKNLISFRRRFSIGVRSVIFCNSEYYAMHFYNVAWLLDTRGHAVDKLNGTFVIIIWVTP